MPPHSPRTFSEREETFHSACPLNIYTKYIYFQLNRYTSSISIEKLRGSRVKAKRIVGGGGVARCIGATERQLPHRTANQQQHRRAPLRDHLRVCMYYYMFATLRWTRLRHKLCVACACSWCVHGMCRARGMGTACAPTYTSYSLALGLGIGLGFDVG